MEYVEVVLILVLQEMQHSEMQDLVEGLPLGHAYDRTVV